MKNYNSVSSQQTRVMTSQQFDEVVEAILNGKYSWACVLILRCANYNPLHYIPYRTYKRLIKDNQQLSHSFSQQKFKVSNSCHQQSVRGRREISQIG